MGLFDTIYIEYPLPEQVKDFQTEEFQTKNLECCMNYYRISKDGKLLLEKRQLFEDEEFNPVIDMQHHGAFRLYAHNKDMVWCTLDAVFKKGKLQEFLVIVLEKIKPIKKCRWSIDLPEESKE